MKKHEIRFNSGGLSLEGVLTLPEGQGPFPAVIVCHPHPLYGGNMDNNVVFHVAQRLVSAGLVSLKFNFRGVDGSQGQFANGPGEQEDVAAAIAFISAYPEINPAKLGLAGYSAGASYSLPVAVRDDRIKSLAAISPALTLTDYSFLRSSHKPKLLVLGDMDDYTLEDRFLELCRTLPEPLFYRLFPGVDHFWIGQEAEMADWVANFFINTLK